MAIQNRLSGIKDEVMLEGEGSLHNRYTSKMGQLSEAMSDFSNKRVDTRVKFGV